MNHPATSYPFRSVHPMQIPLTPWKLHSQIAEKMIYSLSICSKECTSLNDITNPTVNQIVCPHISLGSRPLSSRAATGNAMIEVWNPGYPHIVSGSIRNPIGATNATRKHLDWSRRSNVIMVCSRHYVHVSWITSVLAVHSTGCLACCAAFGGVAQLRELHWRGFCVPGWKGFVRHHASE